MRGKGAFFGLSKKGRIGPLFIMSNICASKKLRYTKTKAITDLPKLNKDHEVTVESHRQVCFVIFRHKKPMASKIRAVPGW